MRILLPLLLLAGLALSQGRRGGDIWSRISEWDSDGDGKVSKEEFSGPGRFFERLDADADGFITENEAKAMRGGGRRGGGNRSQMGSRMAAMFDADKDGRVSTKEWDAFFKKADENEDGILDQGELTAALRGRAYQDTAPKAGASIPAAQAKDARTGATIDLHQVRRPTVLVFGSWT